jgi:hypothetical protein
MDLCTIYYMCRLGWVALSTAWSYMKMLICIMWYE